MSQVYLDEAEVVKTIDALRKGRTALIPSDTIWGISCDAHNSAAVDQIRNIKGSAPDKSFIILVSNLQMLKEYIINVHPRVETLLSFYDKPTSCIYEASEYAPKHLLENQKTIGIRWVRDGVIADIVERFGKAIVSTSANFTGDPFPSSYNDIPKRLLDKIDFLPEIIESEKGKKMGTPSVIISFDKDGELIFLRS